MDKQIQTVCDTEAMPILEIVKEEDGSVTIYEADDMDQKIRFSAVMIPALIDHLARLK